MRRGNRIPAVASPSSRPRIAGVALSLAFVVLTLGAGCGRSDSSSTGEGGDSEGGEVRVTWQEPATEEDAFGRELLEASLTEEVAASLAGSFEMKRPLRVRGVNGLGGGPYYEPRDNSITLPYGFAAMAYEIAAAANPEAGEFELGEMAGAVNSFILAHEFAHALIENFDLPILGREEDAADAISTYVLLNAPNGPRYAADAAAFWAEFSGRQEPPALADYADAHSLDLQRAFDILCRVAGSSPRSLEEVSELEALPEERLETCPDEYAQLVSSIEGELGPHLTDVAREAEE